MTIRLSDGSYEKLMIIPNREGAEELRREDTHLWIPFCSERGQMPVEVMTVHNLSAWSIQVPEDGIPYSDTVILRSCEYFAAALGREIGRVDNSLVRKIIYRRSGF